MDIALAKDLILMAIALLSFVGAVAVSIFGKPKNIDDIRTEFDKKYLSQNADINQKLGELLTLVKVLNVKMEYKMEYYEKQLKAQLERIDGHSQCIQEMDKRLCVVEHDIELVKKDKLANTDVY